MSSNAFVFVDLSHLFQMQYFFTHWKHKKVFCFQGVLKGCIRNKWVKGRLQILLLILLEFKQVNSLLFYKSLLIRINSCNIRSEIWRQFLGDSFFQLKNCKTFCAYRLTIIFRKSFIWKTWTHFIHFSPVLRSV